MSLPVPYQQRAAQRRGGETTVRGRRVNAAPSIADQHQMATAYCSRVRFPSRLTPAVAHCRGTSPDFLIKFARRFPPGSSVRRVVYSPNGQPAAFTRRSAWRAAPQFCFSDHVPAKFADLSEAHLRSPFVESRSDDRERDTLERPKSWTTQPTMRTAT